VKRLLIAFYGWFYRALGRRVALRGEITLVHRKDGRIVEIRKIHNVVHNPGLASLAGLVNGVVTTPFTRLAIGTGTTPVDPNHTALASEITTGGGARKVATVGRETTVVPNDTATWVATWNFTASFAVTESGIFDAPTGGVMLARSVFAPINVEAGSALTLTWKVQFARP
jgi:hypothetical protein